MAEKCNISIITICFNNLHSLLQTCASIDKQSLLPYEHWIIDGSTNDEIKNYLSHKALPNYRKWISEPDRGIADAFNKGIHLANGNILNMLNAGDQYFDSHVLKTVTDTFRRDASISWIHGKYELFRGGKWIVIGKPFDPAKLYRGMRSLNHQSMFVRSSLHKKYGDYDIQLSIAMDYDFVCRISKEKFVFINHPLIKMEADGISNTQYLQSLRQGKEVYLRHFRYTPKIDLWQCRLKILHHLLRSFLGKFLFKIKTKLKLENF